ncbi:unnamed protein product [Gongylonema pulchrum]|uniref:GON7 subunit of KEOPS complex n=1 Tax=Gongylonema pulchrum TaxID=637853 RepID=A0A183CW74_9BILA|nr:unnamed protein product [Gongylonema pulchrum]
MECFSVIQDCILQNAAKNHSLTMEMLRKAIAELLIDIGMSNSKIRSTGEEQGENLMANLMYNDNTSAVHQITAQEESQANVQSALVYEDEDFESDEGESLSVIESAVSDSAKDDDESVASNYKSDSLTNFSNSSATSASK